MSISIRPATQADSPSLSYICLATCDGGKTGEHLFDHGELPGLVYALPYVNLPTTFGYVMVDNDAEKVVGYVLASSDTRRYEREAAQSWWPELQTKYPTPLGKEMDQHYMKLLHNMHTALEGNVAFAPAHLHIDILPEYQRKGWGRRLIGKIVDHLGEQGQAGVWVGLDPKNEDAKKFYGKLGFRDIEGSGVENMGLRFEDFVIL